MKKIVAIFLFGLLVIIASFSKLNFKKEDIGQTSPEQRIEEISRNKLRNKELVEGRTFSVKVDDEKIYHVDINGTEILIQFEDSKNPTKLKKDNIGNISDDSILQIIKSSQKKILKYIEESTVLKEKELLKEYIKETQVKMVKYEAKDSSNTVAEYDLDEKIIFINQDYKEIVCEWMLVHEYIHALADKTNGGKKNMRYPYELFNEVITDIITAELNPVIKEEIISGYGKFYEEIYLYLASVGTEKAIYAYYYGYETILNQINEDELDIFVQLLGEETGNAPIVRMNCINKWAIAD